MSHLSNKENFINNYVLLPDMFQSEIKSSFFEQTLALWYFGPPVYLCDLKLGRKV